MPPYPRPENEIERLTVLREYGILDTPAEKNFDDLVQIASQICDVPIALVSLIDADRQWFKARVGLEATETGRDIAFCSHTIMDSTIMEVEDAQLDGRFADNPLVMNDPSIRFYAGMPLVTRDKFSLGSLCVIDRQPRKLSDVQRASLEALGRQVVAMLELHRSYAELKTLSQQKDEFMRIASHDLKNPLQAIMGAAAMLEMQLAPNVPIPDNLYSLVFMISRRSTAMRRIIEDFLDFNAMEDGKLRLAIDPVDLNAVAEEVVENQRPLAEKKQITLDFTAAAGLSDVSADRQRVAQIMENLVGNAIKFSERNTRVKVATHAVNGGVRFEVCDEGPGLMVDDQLRLFQRYARLSNLPTGGEKSTGLGLAICKGLIEAHGGSIGAENNADCGSIFWFELPGRQA